MNPNDLIYYKQSGGGIQSLGYNFKNILLQKGLPISYSGDNNSALNFFKNINNYSIPTSLVLLNKRAEEIQKNPTTFDLYDNMDKRAEQLTINEMIKLFRDINKR